MNGSHRFLSKVINTSTLDLNHFKYNIIKRYVSECHAYSEEEDIPEDWKEDPTDLINGQLIVRQTKQCVPVDDPSPTSESEEEENDNETFREGKAFFTYNCYFYIYL